MSRTLAPPTGLWKVARLDAMLPLGEHRQTLIDWVAEVSGLTVDEVSTNVRPVALVSQDHDGTFRLHISRFVTDAEGRLIVDHTCDEIHSEPLVYPIDAVPDWVLPAYQKQLDETGGQ